MKQTISAAYFLTSVDGLSREIAGVSAKGLEVTFFNRKRDFYGAMTFEGEPKEGEPLIMYLNPEEVLERVFNGYGNPLFEITPDGVSIDGVPLAYHHILDAPVPYVDPYFIMLYNNPHDISLTENYYDLEFGFATKEEARDAFHRHLDKDRERIYIPYYGKVELSDVLSKIGSSKYHELLDAFLRHHYVDLGGKLFYRSSARELLRRHKNDYRLIQGLLENNPCKVRNTGVDGVFRVVEGKAKLTRE